MALPFLMLYNKIMNYLILAIVGIIGFILGKKLAKFRALKRIAFQNNNSLSGKTEEEKTDMRNKAQGAFDERTEERKEKILEFLTRELDHQKALANCSIEDRKKGITREDVEELLDVSSKTALKYLNELEQENKIIQSSSHGPDVHYTLF